MHSSSASLPSITQLGFLSMQSIVCSHGSAKTLGSLQTTLDCYSHSVITFDVCASRFWNCLFGGALTDFWSHLFDLGPHHLCLGSFHVRHRGQTCLCCWSRSGL